MENKNHGVIYDEEFHLYNFYEFSKHVSIIELNRV